MGPCPNGSSKQFRVEEAERKRRARYYKDVVVVMLEQPNRESQVTLRVEMKEQASPRVGRRAGRGAKRERVTKECGRGRLGSFELVVVVVVVVAVVEEVERVVCCLGEADMMYVV